MKIPLRSTIQAFDKYVTRAPGELQYCFNSFDEFAKMYIVYPVWGEKMNTSSAEEAWRKNPVIQMTMNPEDFQVVR